MRVIAGTYRGRRLQTLKSDKLRPTSDQMRETLFDVLGPAIQGSRFVDAYAGAGAVGIEALSRGAGEVIFIEHHRPAVTLIRKNLAALDILTDYRVMHSEVLTGLEKLDRRGGEFDFIFLDPPYSEISEYHQVLRQLGRSNLIRPSSLVIAEHSRHYFLEEQYGRLSRSRSIRHGDTLLSFFQLS